MKSALRSCHLITAAMLLFAVPAALAQSPQQRIETALAELRTASAAEGKNNPKWKEFGPDLTARLADAERDLRAGRLYSALEFLGRSRIFLEANRSSARAAKEGMSGFTPLWQKARAANPTNVKFVATANSTDPAIVRALSQSAQLRGPVLIAAAGSYAEVTDAEAGFYYLGEGEANLAWSRAVRDFQVRTSGGPWPARSLAPELAALQSKVNAAFKPPLAQDKHPLFIRLNSTLKFAEELNDAGLYFGALQQYLDATQSFTTLTAADKLPEPEALGEALSEAAARFGKSSQDPSIALFFVQRGQSLLAADQPSEAFLRAVASIVNGVLPAYEAVMKAAPAVAQSAVPRVVDVILVRWPYT